MSVRLDPLVVADAGSVAPARTSSSPSGNSLRSLSAMLENAQARALLRAHRLQADATGRTGEALQRFFQSVARRRND